MYFRDFWNPILNNLKKYSLRIVWLYFTKIPLRWRKHEIFEKKNNLLFSDPIRYFKSQFYLFSYLKDLFYKSHHDQNK